MAAAKGMVQNGTVPKMHNGETWTISYETFMPATLRGTSRFTHIFQTKTPATNAGPWVTPGPGPQRSKELLRARAYAKAGSPDIARHRPRPLRDKWITIEWTLTIGAQGTAAFTVRNGTGSGAPVAAHGSMSNVTIPDQGDYIRLKWGHLPIGPERLIRHHRHLRAVQELLSSPQVGTDCRDLNTVDDRMAVHRKYNALLLASNSYLADIADIQIMERM